MVYRITVNGKRKYTEVLIKEYSLEADNLAREEIIRHFLDDEGAENVNIETTPEEVRRFCKEGTYRGLVRCVEKDAFDVEAERGRRQLAEDGVAVKRKNYVFNFETDRFYVPEDKAFEAETRFQKKIPGWPIVLIVTVAGLAALAGAIFLLPDIIQFIDNFAGKMGF